MFCVAFCFLLLAHYGSCSLRRSQPTACTPPSIQWKDEALISFEGQVMSNVGRNLSIDGVGSIVHCSFECSHVKYIYFACAPGSSIETVPDGFFQNCFELEFVKIGDSVKRIGSNAFSGCTNLKNIDLPLSLEYLGDRSFAECVNLPEVYVPPNLKDFSSDAFHRNRNLGRITVDPKSEQFRELAGGLGIFTTIVSLGISTISLVVKKGLKKFTNRKGRDLMIDFDISAIGPRACEGTELESVILASPIESIYYRAFADNAYLESVEMDDSVIFMDDEVFMNCPKLRSLKLSASLNNISVQAFRSCSSLESVIIPESVDEIREKAFKECSSLKSITIPAGVTKIGNGAFSRCSSLEKITVNNGNTAYSSIDGVLLDAEAKSLIQFPSGKGGAYTIPDSVTFIDVSAFKASYLLTEFRVGKNDLFSVKDGVLFDKSGSSLLRYPCGKEGSDYSIPENVNSIHDEAFLEVKHLTSVTIGNAVNNIGYRTFGKCDLLESVTFLGKAEPETCDNYAFSGCEKLRSICVPADYDSTTFCGMPVDKSIDCGKHTPESSVISGTNKETMKVFFSFLLGFFIHW